MRSHSLQGKNATDLGYGGEGVGELRTQDLLHLNPPNISTGYYAKKKMFDLSIYDRYVNQTNFKHYTRASDKPFYDIDRIRYKVYIPQPL